jgi:hypothetical protein
MKVIVNPNYSGKGWHDPRSKMNFMKDMGAIEIPEGINMLNINKYINLNYLVVVEEDKKEEVVEETATNPKTPRQLLAEDEPKAEEPTVEEPAEEVEEPEAEVVAEEVENPEVMDEVEEAQEPEEEPAAEEAEDIKEVPEEDDAHICMYCGKELKTAGGRASHERACKKNPENN